MVHALPFWLTGWSAWSATLTSVEEWRAWAGGTADAAGWHAPVAAPAGLRRRATTLGQRSLAAALSLPDVGVARYVLSTRHGELDRTVSLLNSIDSREPLSPADFSMSVHNSSIGLLSMAAGNRGGHTAVSAGAESFCFGLLEAVTCLCERPGQPVILVHQDEAAGAAFAGLIPERDVLSPIAIAVALTHRQQDGAIAMTMSTRPADGSPATPDHAERFLRFVLSGASDAVSVGDRMIWEWHRV